MTNENVDVPLGSGSKVDDLMAETEEQSNKNSDKALRGRAVQIVEIDKDDHSFKLKEDALRQILSKEQIKDLPVCVVSVAGKLFHGYTQKLKTRPKPHSKNF